MLNLVQKYNVPGPRYTSYPTVPFWDSSTFSVQNWIESLNHPAYKNQPISLYIHLPFCESLCTFCACNKRITKQHSVEQPYIEAVLKEWNMYVSILGENPVIEEIHLGGGTPTFFSANNLKKLIEGIFEKATKAQKYEFSFEGHPNNTTKKQLQTLFDLGFRRVSFGIQDYNTKVQQAIHRLQPFENVKNVTQWAREMGYTSIGHDLIFGLPFQNLEDVKHTIKQTKKLQPDRIAFYSYAHTPWIKGNGQRGFNEADLPPADEKRIQYEEGKIALEEAGYSEIGMDHFAQETDPLLQYQKQGKLHRNFMGYTTTQSKKMIGLGVSSISDSWFGFAQNEKDLKDYYQKIENGQLPVFRGHILTDKDLIIRKHILNLMCNFETSWSEEENDLIDFKDILIGLLEMQADNLVILGKNYVQVTNQGQAFIRNICMAFDLRLKANKPDQRIFSMTI
ncbi:MAG: oxygen-independent coproporphyrinogen III oxidase [Flavobacteriaceae bacterium]|nr:oxygen-independent coproporphyrinogen III oxidase [Flavobacteriaceae bacterium]